MAEEKLIHRRGGYRAGTGARVGRRTRVARYCRPVMLAVASLLVAAGAQAQSACDLLKTSLAARLRSDPSSYQLEAVPAATPLPPEGKFIGTCEGGAKKILFSRVTAGAPAVAKASVAERVPAPAPAPAPAPTPTPTPTPAPAPALVVLPEKPRQGLVGSVVRADPPVAAASSPASDPLPQPVWRPIETASVMPLPMPVPQPSLAASEVADTPIGEVAAGMSVQRMEVVDATRREGSLTERSSRLAADHWTWLLALVLVPLGLGAWAWLNHHRAYDEAGLPRGPRL